MSNDRAHEKKKVCQKMKCSLWNDLGLRSTLRQYPKNHHLALLTFVEKEHNRKDTNFHEILIMIDLQNINRYQRFHLTAI